MLGMILVVLATVVLLAVAFNFDDRRPGERRERSSKRTLPFG